MRSMIKNKSVLMLQTKAALVDQLLSLRELCGDWFSLDRQTREWRVKPVYAKAPELQQALEEAIGELCHSNGMADDFRCGSLDGRGKCGAGDGKCFVQRWRKVLNESKGGKDNA